MAWPVSCSHALIPIDLNTSQAVGCTCDLRPDRVGAMPTTIAVAHIGCAGWSIPRQYAAYFPDQGTHLERYAQQLPAVEINSSFYRPHRPETYARWAASVPD